MPAEVVTSESMKQLLAAAENAARGVRDRKSMEEARKKMDEIRNTILLRNGVLDIGVPAIRELRGELPPT